MQIDDDELVFNNSNIRSTKVLSSVYEFYISGDIKSPANYIDMFDIIRHSKEDDTVKIYVNSYGGDLFTAIQFLRVLSEARATIVVSIEGACMSAATLLFLSADHVEITPHSSIMIHDYSSGTFGKGGEMYKKIQHERKWSETLYREVYQDFLTPTEITRVIEGDDIWLEATEVMHRMEFRASKLQELTEKSIEDIVANEAE